MNSKQTMPTVHVSRTSEPQHLSVSDELKLKNARSRQAYPHLNLSESEYVIAVVRRHPIGLFVPVFLGIALMMLTAIAMVNPGLFGLNIDTANQPAMSLILFLFIVLIAIITYFYSFIYTSNKFYLTNECVIQNIQTGPFSNKEQSISLSNIEDASYDQSGIIQQIFNYGTIKLSTVGDEHTYVFTYVASPDHQRDMLHNAVEAFKNGRPITVD